MPEDFLLQLLTEALQRLHQNKITPSDHEMFKFALYYLELNRISPTYSCPMCLSVIKDAPVPLIAVRTFIDAVKAHSYAIRATLGFRNVAKAQASACGRPHPWRGLFLTDEERMLVDSYRMDESNSEGDFFSSAISSKDE
jgi:hypothetical protein